MTFSTLQSGELRDRLHPREVQAVDSVLLRRPESRWVLEFLSSLTSPDEVLCLAAGAVQEEGYQKFFAELRERHKKPPGSFEPVIIGVEDVD